MIIRINAYAKTNLFLEICGKRNDGYHNISTVFHELSLHDTISVSKSDKITFSCTDKILETDDNLCIKASKLFFETSGIVGGCEIRLEKHIPYGAGLGGGSSDAAAVFRALDILYGTRMSVDSMERTVSEIGSDIPFFIRGGTQFAFGRGEKLTPVRSVYFPFVLIVEGKEKTDTALAYRAADRLEAPERVSADEIVSSIIGGCTKETAGLMFNRFGMLYPNDERIGLITDLGGHALISGSGSAVVSVFGTERQMTEAKEIFEKKYICHVCTSKK